MCKIDISGVPGIGKTLCVSRVMDKVTEKYKKSFKYVYINSMKIKKAHDIFRLLYVELTSPKERKTQIETAMFLLDDLFRKGIELEDYKGLPGTMKY